MHSWTSNHIDNREEEHLVNTLLASDHNLEDKELYMRALNLGFDLQLPRIALVLELEPKENRYFNINLHLGYDHTKAHIKQELVYLLKTTTYLTAQDMVAPYSSQQIVVLKAFLNTNNLSQIYRAMEVIATQLYQTIKNNNMFDIAMAYGSIVALPDKFRESYQEAVEIINLGKACGKNSGFIAIDSFLFEALLGVLPKRFIHSHLEPILEKISLELEDDYNILATAEAFIDNNFNILRTSQKQFLHRNTITSRLDKLNQLTGLDPRKGLQDSFWLKLAMAYHRLNNNSMRD